MHSQELSKLISLDYTNFNMFELAPLTEYELYIRSFGNSDCRQIAVQCNEDRWVTSLGGDATLLFSFLSFSFFLG